MKRLFAIAALVLLVGSLGAGAQSLADNSYFKRSMELKAMADRAFDDGDYDAATDYALQSREYAALSDRYVDKMLAMIAADRALATGTKGLDRAKASGAPLLAALLYEEARSGLEAARGAYEKEAFVDAKGLAEAAALKAEDAFGLARSEAAKALAAGSREVERARAAGAPSLAKASYDEAAALLGQARAAEGKTAYGQARDLAEAAGLRAGIALAEARDAAAAALAKAGAALEGARHAGAPELEPSLYAKAALGFDAAGTAQGREEYEGAEGLARTAAADAEEAVALSRVAALNAMLAARERLDWAASVGAAEHFPAEYGRGEELMAKSGEAFDGGAFAEAKTLADAVVLALAGVTEGTDWPASYAVRLIPNRRDCLWRIAEYPFIYNDPLKWPVIYEANKKSFKDPGNPNLIFPGQILVIPSIGGEVRKGAYDPAKEYLAFPKTPPAKK